MDGHLLRNPMRRALTAAALGLSVAVTAPAVADEPTPQWLSAIGDFVRDGLAPPRTAEDLFREEKAAAQPRPPTPPAAHVAAPAPAPVPAASVFEPEPEPEPALAPAPPKAKVEAAVKKPEHSVQPSLRAVVTPAEIKARPVLPPPEPLTGSRIAATATLDQALKLGGAATLYGQRVNKPQATP